MNTVRLVTLAPGHFHAALIHKQMRPSIDPRGTIFAPLDEDLLAHLARIHGFNTRDDQPTSWEIDLHTSADFLARFRSEARAGDIAVIAGRNRRKIDWMLAAVEAGLHVLADKPLIIDAERLPDLQRLIDQAQSRGVVVDDVMTEREEITSIIQRGLVQRAEVLGDLEVGSPEDPAVRMKSIHSLKKLVAGVPLRRPSWFFDIREQGEALADVGTHLVDLVMWILFPEQEVTVDDVHLISASREAVKMTKDQFAAVTGKTEFPAESREFVRDGVFSYWCNNRLTYALRGIHVHLDVLWDYESPQGGDVHFAEVRGSRTRIVIEQNDQTRGIPEVFVYPTNLNDLQALEVELAKVLREWEGEFPGLSIRTDVQRCQILIPERYRVGHEAHFTQVLDRFLGDIDSPDLVPVWEKTNLLTKYHTTTNGVALGLPTA